MHHGKTPLEVEPSMHFAQECPYPDNALLRKGVPKGVVDQARCHLPVMAGFKKVSFPNSGQVE